MVAMVSTEIAWRATVTFCRKVILEKEDQERVRRGEAFPLAGRVAAEQRVERERGHSSRA